MPWKRLSRLKPYGVTFHAASRIFTNFADHPTTIVSYTCPVAIERGASWIILTYRVEFVAFKTSELP